MRISDWSSDVCSSDLLFLRAYPPHSGFPPTSGIRDIAARALQRAGISGIAHRGSHIFRHSLATELLRSGAVLTQISQVLRSEEHTSELQSLMRNSYAVFCLNKKRMKDL